MTPGIDFVQAHNGHVLLPMVMSCCQWSCVVVVVVLVSLVLLNMYKNAH